MITRRNLLASTPALVVAVATPAAAAAACVMPIDTDDDAALFALFDQYQAAKAEFDRAKSDLDWIAAEWRHVWPLAPEEILGGANANMFQPRGGTPERDIVGKFLKRDVVGLTKRLPSKRRRQGGPTCFFVENTVELSEWLAWHRADVPKGRTEKALAANVKRRADFIKKYERALELARAYEAETARLREVSGANRAKERVAASSCAFQGIADRIIGHPATTFEGIAIKAEAFLGCYRSKPAPKLAGDMQEGSVWSFGWNIADDIERLRDAAKGGAA